MYQPNIFRVYDIRGIAGEEFDEKFVADLARAYASYLNIQGQNACCVGRDGRQSSPGYHLIFMEELSKCGVHVYDLGIVTTPMGYFSCFQHWAPNCVVVTASHNPKEYNGFKLVVNQQALRSELIQELKDILESKDKQVQHVQTPAPIEPIDIEGEYLKFLKSHFKFQKPHKFIVDCGNGVTGMFARKVFDLFGFETKILYEEVDADFPNHPADPTKAENLEDMIQILQKNKEKYEFGIGYDGDGDRIGIVTPSGHLLYGDQTLLLLTEEIVHKYKNPVIIADVKSSKVFYDGAKKLGANPLMFKTGHSLIKAKLNETPECPLAGEMSGHIFYKDDYFGFDDSLYVTLRFIRVLEEMEEDLETWHQSLPRMFNTPELHVPCSDEHKSEVVDELTKIFKEKYPDAKLITIDGIRLEWSNKWALIRASNTTPVLVLRFEAASQEDCQQLQDDITEIVKSHTR